jgi:hypothetical protein
MASSTWTESAKNRAKVILVVSRCSWIAESGVVQHIERLRANFQFLTFRTRNFWQRKSKWENPGPRTVKTTRFPKCQDRVAETHWYLTSQYTGQHSNKLYLYSQASFVQLSCVILQPDKVVHVDDAGKYAAYKLPIGIGNDAPM